MTSEERIAAFKALPKEEQDRILDEAAAKIMEAYGRFRRKGVARRTAEHNAAYGGMRPGRF